MFHYIPLKTAVSQTATWQISFFRFSTHLFTKAFLIRSMEPRKRLFLRRAAVDFF
jgi:hypothetical protein